MSIGEISFSQVSDIPMHERFIFNSFRRIIRLSKFLGRLLIFAWIIENISGLLIVNLL